MLNSIEQIKSLWPAEALNLSDDNSTGISEYELFLEQANKGVKQRLVNLVSLAAYEDVQSSSTFNTPLEDALKEAELELFHIKILEYLWRQKSAGIESEVEMPSGVKIKLQSFGSKEFESLITNHLANVNRLLSDFI